MEVNRGNRAKLNCWMRLSSAKIILAVFQTPQDVGTALAHRRKTMGQGCAGVAHKLGDPVRLYPSGRATDWEARLGTPDPVAV